MAGDGIDVARYGSPVFVEWVAVNAQQKMLHDSTVVACRR
jgi:hypothetical protein